MHAQLLIGVSAPLRGCRETPRSRVSSYFPPQLNGNTAAAGLQHAQQQLTEPSRVLEVFFLTQGAFERGQRTKKDGYMRT